MMQWQPIESAPKDGTNILVWIQYGDTPVVAEFYNNRWMACTEHYDVGCMSYCYGGSVTTGSHFVPTHWMPLPKSPDEEKEKL